MGVGETDLFKRLEQISPDTAARIRRLGDIVEPLLPRIYSIFPAYTDHGKSHSEHVMSVLGWLLPDGKTAALSTEEMFYLLAAALLHDIGMLDAVDKANDPKAVEEIRDSHHLRSEQYVRKNYERLGLEKPEAEVIGEICRSHRKTSIQQVVNIPGCGGGSIQLQLLCAAVRIADELHLTADRAPQIVLDAIRPPQDSLSHFKRHLSITGVGPLDFSQGVIQIAATVQTSAEEAVLYEMVSKIQEKLTEVQSIFEQHGLPWKKIELTLQRREVVERKVVLHLAEVGGRCEDELVAKLGESPDAIETCIQDLRSLHRVVPTQETGSVCLAEDDQAFEYFLRKFLRTEDELQFVLSPYAERCIEAFSFDSFSRRFDAVYDRQEREDRILALRTSPTALYLLLLVAEFQLAADPAIIPRRVVLDESLVLGVLTDLFRFPQIAQVKGIAPAIGAIQGRVEQESSSLLRILAAAGPDRGRDIRDVFDDLITPPEMERPESGREISFAVTVAHPKGSIERGLAFPHLLKAAMVSGEKLELVGSRVQLSSKDPRIPREAVDSPLHTLTITPQRPAKPLYQQQGTLFCRVEIDRSRKRITLFTDVGRSADYSKYPVVLSMAVPADGRNATFSPSVYPSNIDVRQALEIDQMFQWLKNGDFHRLRIMPDQPELLPLELQSQSLLEALGSDLQSREGQAFLDESYSDTIQCLAQLQDKLEKRIPLVIRLTDGQRAAIEKLAMASANMTGSEIDAALQSIAEQSKSDLTTVRVSTYFPHGQIDSDQFLGPFPRLVPSITLDDEKKTGEVADLLKKGESTVWVTRYFALDLPTLGQKIIEGYTKGATRSFLPDEATEKAVRTACQVTILPFEDKLWYREQVIHYRIRDVSAIRFFVDNSQRLLADGKVEEAVRELTEGLRRFPQDASISGLLGWAHYRANDLNAAYQYSQKAVDLESLTEWSVAVPFAYYNLGLCSLLQQRFEESMTWYEMAVAREKGPVLDESIQDLESAMTAETPEALFALAFLYEHRQDFSRAITLYEQFLNSDSQHDKHKELAQAAVERLR